MKKGVLRYFLPMVLVLVFSMFLVSAAEKGQLFKPLENIITSFINLIEPLARQLLGTTDDASMFFAKFLFFLIVFSIIWVALSYVDFFASNTWVLAVISIAASVLSTRFLVTNDIIQTVLLPYTTLGVALSAGLPFVLYFLVIDVGLKSPAAAEDYRSIIRKTAWVFFAVVFIVLWLVRIDDLTAKGDSLAGWIYPITAIIAIVMWRGDRTIQRKMAETEIKNSGKANVEEAVLLLEGKIKELTKRIADGHVTAAQAARLKSEYQKRIDTLLKY